MLSCVNNYSFAAALSSKPQRYTQHCTAVGGLLEVCPHTDRVSVTLYMFA